MFVDTHAHLNFKEYENDIKDVLERSFDAGVRKIINVGSNYKTSVKSVRLCPDYSLTRTKSGGEAINSSRLRSNNKIQMYATVGCHPIHLTQDITESAMFDGKEYKFKTKKEIFDKEKYQELINKNKDIVVGIGETGLDYFHICENNLTNSSKPIAQNYNLKIKTEKQIQRKVFEDHIELAIENNLPLVLHCRGSKKNPYGAYDEMIEILKTKNEKRKAKNNQKNIKTISSNNKSRGVIHCFVGNLRQAKEFIIMGFYIGVNGIVTFKKSNELQEIIKKISLDMMLLETDCPYLSPDPMRGKRNEPANIPIIAQKIAELKNIDAGEVEKITTRNTEKLFNI